MPCRDSMKMAKARLRGYIASRPIMGERAPQHVQNLVVRDYARRKNLHFLLSATEYAMPECFLILQQVLDGLDEVDGIIAYSLFMLPDDTKARRRIWDRLLVAGKSLHGALESIAVTNETDVSRVEDLWTARRVLPYCPATF